MNIRISLQLFLCLGAVTALPAQTLFSDSLATDAGNWIASPANQGGGSTAFAASALGYTVVTPTGDDVGYRTLDTYAAPSTSSWSAQVDLHLAAFGGLTSNQYVNLNLMVVKSADPFAFNASFAIDRYNDVSIVQDIDTHIVTNSSSTQLTEVLLSSVEVTLRVSFDASTSHLAFAYDSDGGAAGATFITAHTADISAWTMSGGNFGLLLVGSSGYTGEGVGPAVSAADAYFRNFSVNAVPEPSTYALLAGALALGAGLRRRWRGNAAA
jgi:hypothetical protein